MFVFLLLVINCRLLLFILARTVQEPSEKVAKLSADQTASSVDTKVVAGGSSGSSSTEDTAMPLPTSSLANDSTNTATPTVAAGPAPVTATASATAVASTAVVGSSSPLLSPPSSPPLPLPSSSATATAAAAEQVKKLRDEIHSSALVSEADKLAVDKFFHDKGTHWYIYQTINYEA
jgi:hypothetical protein